MTSAARTSRTRTCASTRPMPRWGTQTRTAGSLAPCRCGTYAGDKLGYLGTAFLRGLNRSGLKSSSKNRKGLLAYWALHVAEEVHVHACLHLRCVS